MLVGPVVLALTGSTGALGGQVARALADLSPRLLVRDPRRAPDLGRPVEVRTCAYGDGAASVAALEGVETLLMVSAAESVTRREEHLAFVAAASEAGVRHVVYTSFAGAAPDATFTLGRDHHATEEALRSSVPSVTVLRDNFYLDVLPLFADVDGVLAGPAGTGRVAAVARADAADVAALVLRDPAAHRGATYDLTGPEALGLDEVAERASAVTGRSLRYVDQTLEEAYRTRREAYPEAASWQLDAWVSTYTAIADGSVAQVSDDVRRLLGRAPRTLEDVVEGR